MQYEKHAGSAPPQAYATPAPLPLGAPLPLYYAWRSPPPRRLTTDKSKKRQTNGTPFFSTRDIEPGLAGRHAEMFWPDDELWYLIEIQVSPPLPSPLPYYDEEPPPGELPAS